jgi:hypothetical protein
VAGFPIPIAHPETVLPLCNPQTVLNIGGLWGTITAGQTVMASDGYRFVWSADSMIVIYSLGGQFYGQGSRGFVNEIRTAPIIEGARRAEFMVKLAEVEMKFLMGIVAGASGIGFAIVIGVEVAEFMVENRENFAKWESQLEAVLRAREYLKKYTPTIYDALFYTVLKQVYRDTKAQIPEAITAQTVAFGVGVIFGTIGKKLVQGKFSILSLVFVILEQLVIRFALNVGPGALQIVSNEYQSMAAEIIQKARDAGVTLPEGDVKKIIEEARQHPQEIKQAYEMMKSSFEQMKKTPAVDK